MPELLSSGRTVPDSYREYQPVVNSKLPTTEYHGTTHTRNGCDGMDRLSIRAGTDESARNLVAYAPPIAGD